MPKEKEACTSLAKQMTVWNTHQEPLLSSHDGENAIMAASRRCCAEQLKCAPSHLAKLRAGGTVYGASSGESAACDASGACS